MIKKIAFSLAAATMALTAAPAIAQDDDYVEQPRTTWELRFIELAPGAEGAFLESLEKYYNPAREKAGMKPAELHFLHNVSHDILLVMEMPGGMANFDTHRSDSRMAFRAALIEVTGSEEAMEKLFEESEKLIKAERSVFSHTHP